MTKPYYSDLHSTLYCQDFRENDLPDESVQMVCTSPPYWGLRKYSGEQELIWLPLDKGKDCEHQWNIETISAETWQRDGHVDFGDKSPKRSERPNRWQTVTHERGFCSLCGAWKGAYGLEPTPEMYIEHTIEILREIRRVLRKDGVVFWNIGDSYQGGNRGSSAESDIKRGDQGGSFQPHNVGAKGIVSPSRLSHPNIKPKDLCLIPFRVALEAQKPYYTGRIKRELDRVWMAAMIDSEGTVCGFRHERPDGNIRTGVLVFVTNGDENILGNCDRIWSGSRYIESLKAGDKVLGATATRDCWRWQIQKAEDRSLFLREIYPYMVAKKLQVMIGWNLNEYSLQAKKMGRGGETKEVKARREILAKLLSDLNQHRPVDIPKWVKEPPGVLEPGWWVRSVIVWSKNNPMPESVTDRPTESHEYILLLTKSARYYWDADAVRENQTGNAHSRGTEKGNEAYQTARGSYKDFKSPVLNLPAGRNIRSVWEFPTQPYPKAHFAVFPEKLPEICIKAATPEVGCCSKCGAPWERIVRHSDSNWKERREAGAKMGAHIDDSEGQYQSAIHGEGMSHDLNAPQVETLGWQPTCKCNADKAPSVVLDPFAGAGTTLWVAKRLNRQAVGYEISQEYCDLAVKRMRQQVLI